MRKTERSLRNAELNATANRIARNSISGTWITRMIAVLPSAFQNNWSLNRRV
ncbi:Uncharacterised protein [Bifidobacterium breve]|nr:Uncharacterised protein [Bifidobacterium breve]